ncbi:MAG: hypothetical protein V7647_2106 [Acidobacteriota bacterium]|jgi:hypothetical protein
MTKSAPRAPRFPVLWVVSLIVVTLLAAWPADARAQVWMGADPPRKGSVQISAGVISFGGFDMGVRNAEETRNINTGTGPFALFASHSRIAATPGGQFRVGVYLSPQLSLETSVQYGRPTLSSSLTSDAEQAPSLTASDTIGRYVVDGSLLFHLTRLAFSRSRAVPFLAGGAGYLRELHESNEFVATGHEYHAGGGLNVWFGQGRHRIGLRADVGASIRQGGADFRSGRRTVPAAGASLAYLF